MEIQGDGADKMLGDFLGAVGWPIPGDLVMQIVIRLPVKSILRFKSVCRAWYALFSSPMFIQHHLRMASSAAKMKNLLSLFAHTNNYHFGNPVVFFLLADRSCGERTSILLNPPFECDLEDIHVVGSINGMVCLNFFKNPTFIVLWNPATRKHWQIPNPQLVLANHESESVGFAYDEITDIYKVVRILYPKDNVEIYGARVEIYSCGTNTWRRVDFADFPRLLDRRKCVTVVSGSPYWFAIEFEHQESASVQQLMMWFDPSVEAFRFQPICIPFSELVNERIGLGAIGEHLVAFSDSFRSEEDASVTFLDFWKLNKFDDDDDGGNNPINGEKPSMEFSSRLRLVDALGFSGNGKVIALNAPRILLICDPHSREFEIIHRRDAHWDWDSKVYDYTESLVSPYGVASLC